MTRILVHGLASTRVVPPLLIYGLIDPRTQLVRYIGKSSSGAARPKQHQYTKRSAADVSSTYNRRWIESLQKKGLIFEIVVLESLDDVTKLDEAECWWIAFGRACGWPLTNYQEGGVPTAETLAKMIEHQKRKRECVAQAIAEKQHKAEEKQQLMAEYEAAAAERLRLGRVMIFSPAKIAQIEAREEEQRRRKEDRRQRRMARRRSPAEIERRCFELFEKHAGHRRVMIDVVIGARVTSSTAHWLYDVWLRSATRTPQRMAVDHADLENRLALEFLGAILPG